MSGQLIVWAACSSRLLVPQTFVADGGEHKINKIFVGAKATPLNHVVITAAICFQSILKKSKALIDNTTDGEECRWSCRKSSMQVH
jgi:hypothetical protein